MKAILVALALTLAGAAGGALAEPPPIPMHDAPRALPEISFADAAGTPQTPAAWRGKVVLLNIWATWCGPCREEMPTLDRLQHRLGGPHFAVVALSIDRAGVGVVERFFTETGVAHLDIAIDESGRAARDLGARGLPTTLLIAPDGRELGRLVGAAEWDTPEMVAFLEGVVASESGKGDME